jgi:hypothetical protein
LLWFIAVLALLLLLRPRSGSRRGTYV